MKPWFRSGWPWLALLLVFVAVGGVLYLQQSVVNVMHPALDKLSAIKLSERWSNPEMLKIRELGVKAVPSLRQVLREKNSPTIRFLLWVKAKWPGATKYYSHFPDPNKLTERRWVACQALQTLGLAGKSAAPELIAILKGKDLRDVNSAMMALGAIGIDAEICDQLDALLEQGVPPFAASQIVGALGTVKPPSVQTLKALTAGLANPDPFVQEHAAETLGRLGVGTPAVVSALKQLQATSTNSLVLVGASAALWDLEKESRLVLPRVFQVLENELANFSPFPGPGGGGQGVSASEQSFMMSAYLFQRMKLSEAEKSRALGLLESCCEKSDRIFIRMLLLSPMIDLGFPEDKCLAVCRAGLSANEDYYRIQAARLLAHFGENHSLEGVNLEALLRAPDVGVRVYAAKVHWLNNHQAKAVVPVLIESLDRSKHQSYYYAELQPVALAVLGDIGPDAGEAARTLENLIHDPNPVIAKLASEALAKIQR